MPPAARVSDLQVGPGGGGPLASGAANVRIGGMPAARAGDPTGTGGVIASGSPTVFIGGKPAARVGDKSSGGGLLLTGTPNVLIGDHAGVGRLEAVGGGPNAGTPEKPGDKKKLKELEKQEKKEKEKLEKEQKEQEKKDAKAKKQAEGGDEEGFSLLGSPANAELIGSFLKMAQGIFGSLAGALPPGTRDMVANALAQAQQAFGAGQIGGVNQSVAQLQAALQQLQGGVPPDVLAAAAAEAGAPPGAPPAAQPDLATAGDPSGVGPRLSVGEGSVLDSLPTIPITPKK